MVQNSVYTQLPKTTIWLHPCSSYI